jgi:hypothetical protein
MTTVIDENDIDLFEFWSRYQLRFHHDLALRHFEHDFHELQTVYRLLQDELTEILNINTHRFLISMEYDQQSNPFDDLSLRIQVEYALPVVFLLLLSLIGNETSSFVIVHRYLSIK